MYQTVKLEPNVKDPDPNNEDPQISSNEFVKALITGLQESNSTLLQANQTVIRELFNQGNRPTNSNQNIKEIPIFMGTSSLEYQTFKTIFNNNTSAETNTSSKLTTLRAKVDPYKVLPVFGHLQINDDNYVHAWKLLDSRYDDPRSTFINEIDAIINVQPTIAEDIKTLLNLTDTLQRCTYNLQTMGVNIPETEVFLVCMTLRKFDSDTRGEFERMCPNKSKIPSLEDVNNFLDNQYQRLKSVQVSNTSQQKTRKRETLTHLSNNQEAAINCLLCSEEHHTTKCPDLKETGDKMQLLKEKKVCIFCGSHKYDYQDPCRKRRYLKCDVCNGQHYTLLHPVKKEEQPKTVAMFCENNSSSHTILPTAIMIVRDEMGNEIPVRCLLDQCSQSSYILEDLTQKLKLRKQSTNIRICSVGGSITNKINKMVTVPLILNGEKVPFKALVIRKITRPLPAQHTPLKWVKEQKYLADPNFNKPGEIHLLLGSNILPSLFQEGLKRIGGYLLQNTKVGWIVSGPSSNDVSTYTSTNVTLNEMELELRAFWDQPIKEDLMTINPQAGDYCEKQFLNQHYRTEEGRYVVPIPWKPDNLSRGGSYQPALYFY